jgi:pimeloyl-ACP methyl ester carboxylesterase
MHFTSVKKIFLLILSGISFAGCDMQQNMLYYPDLRLPSESELATKGLRFWPAGPIGYRGYVANGEIRNAKGTIIVFHGNAGTAADRDYYLSALGALRYRVILAEYPGYGSREGILDEQSLVSDARETIRIAARTHQGPIYLLGESLGCGVAAGAAGDASLNIAGILLITPWNTLLAVAKDHYPYLPVGWFMKDRYDNAENLKSFRGSIAVLGAQGDEVVPVRHARELFALLPGEKRIWIVPGAGHNDWPMRMDPSTWLDIMEFLSGSSHGRL